MARLILMFKDKILDYQHLSHDESLTIGRHTSNRIVINNLAVSGYHARVDAHSEGYSITDLQSKNGTYVNHKPVAEGALSHKDLITIGKHTLLVDLFDEVDVDHMAGDGAGRPARQGDMDDGQTMFLDTPQARQMRGEDPPPPPPREPVFADHDNLALLSGGEGEVKLSQRQLTIGNNHDADIVVGGVWALLVGGPAAIIAKQAGDYYMSYAGGVIKPRRNGAKVKGTVKLHNEDILEVGPVKVRVQLSKRATAA